MNWAEILLLAMNLLQTGYPSGWALWSPEALSHVLLAAPNSLKNSGGGPYVAWTRNGIVEVDWERLQDRRHNQQDALVDLAGLLVHERLHALGLDLPGEDEADYGPEYKPLKQQMEALKALKAPYYITDDVQHSLDWVIAGSP